MERLPDYDRDRTPEAGAAQRTGTDDGSIRGRTKSGTPKDARTCGTMQHDAVTLIRQADHGRAGIRKKQALETILSRFLEDRKRVSDGT